MSDDDWDDAKRFNNNNETKNSGWTAAKDIGRLIERGGKTVRKLRQNTSCKVRHCMKNFVKVCLNFGKQRGRTRLI